MPVFIFYSCCENGCSVNLNSPSCHFSF
uniref:Uncharacterized protein n=1 Tax=Anguilla anguilla TaxID=7936 RepID=A0A0E9VCQ3_ANGAN